MRAYCNALKQSGYWKGNPCNSLVVPGRLQCANHLPEVMKAREASGKKTVTKPVKRK